jgi:hypothetical protein
MKADDSGFGGGGGGTTCGGNRLKGNFWRRNLKIRVLRGFVDDTVMEMI